METSEILSTLERLRVAAALGHHALVSELQEQLADSVRGISALGQAAVCAGQGRWQAVLDAAGGLNDPQPAVARFAALLRAEALLEIGRGEGCLEGARMLLGKEPGDHQARVLAGRALFRLRRLDEAAVELERAVQAVPRSFEAHYGLGLVLLARGDLSRALVELRLAQQLNPLDEGPYRALARLFRTTGQVVEGADRVGGLLQGQLVASPGLLLDLAELELLAGRPERLPAMLRTVEQHAALEPLHLLELARLWCELEDVAAVEGLVVRAEGLEHPRAAGVLIELRALHAELVGDGALARQLHGQACTRLPGHWLPHSRAALLYLYQPDERSIRAAEAHLGRAVELAPRTPDVRLLVAILQVARGDTSVRPVLVMVAEHPGMRPSLRRLARSTLEMVDQRSGLADPG